MYGLLKSDDDASKVQRSTILSINIISICLNRMLQATEEMIATYCMNEMDTNGDGKIKLEEYIKAYPKITLVRAPERVGLIRCGRNVLALRLVNMHDDP